MTLLEDDLTSRPESAPLPLVPVFMLGKVYPVARRIETSRDAAVLPSIVELVSVRAVVALITEVLTVSTPCSLSFIRLLTVNLFWYFSVPPYGTKRSDVCRLCISSLLVVCFMLKCLSFSRRVGEVLLWKISLGSFTTLFSLDSLLALAVAAFTCGGSI